MTTGDFIIASQSNVAEHFYVLCSMLSTYFKSGEHSVITNEHFRKVDTLQLWQGKMTQTWKCKFSLNHVEQVWGAKGSKLWGVYQLEKR